VSIISLTD